MDIILKYFPDLTETQKEQFGALYDLYTDWNSKINVISRKDITNLYEHHVLHSLGIAKFIQFKPGTRIMDLGTGGGFPKNVTTRHCRAEEEKQMFDFVVSRAVMPLTDLLKIIRKNISKEQHNAFPNGLVCLKGGELEKEVFPVKHQTMVTELKDFFSEEFFETKKVVYVTVNN